MKINEYPESSGFALSDVFIMDGATGTKKVSVEKLPYFLFDNVPEMHNRVFRGKNLGNAYTTAQKDEVASGRFKDLWLGDYWEIGGRKWRIVDFNYYINTGDVRVTTNHVTVMPDTVLAQAVWNSPRTLAGGYANSQIRTNMAAARNIVNSAFGIASILSHREALSTAVDNTTGRVTGVDWYDTTIELPDEMMLFGSSRAGNLPSMNSNLDLRVYHQSHRQLALFGMTTKYLILDGDAYWVRDTSISGNVGIISYGASSYARPVATESSNGVRPVFNLKG